MPGPCLAARMSPPSQLHGVPNGDAYLRMNFLYQAAVLLADQGADPAGSRGARELSRFYVRTMREVAQKLVIRMYHLSG